MEIDKGEGELGGKPALWPSLYASDVFHMASDLRVVNEAEALSLWAGG